MGSNSAEDLFGASKAEVVSSSGELVIDCLSLDIAWILLGHSVKK